MLGWGARPTPRVKHNQRPLCIYKHQLLFIPGALQSGVDTWPDGWVVDADIGGVLCTSQDWPLKTPVGLSLLFLLRPWGDDGAWWKELVLLNPCVQGLLPNTGTGILLTLEYGFELCKPIYMWILSNKHIVSPLYSWVLHRGFNQLQIENSIFWRCRRLTICIFCAILYNELEHLWLLVSAERGDIWNQSPVEGWL